MFCYFMTMTNLKDCKNSDHLWNNLQCLHCYQKLNDDGDDMTESFSLMIRIKTFIIGGTPPHGIMV